ncbi:tRNA 5-carboxymethoxyuridine methyltransferase [Paenibacillus solanacearum]|uniref:tRNA 5-carboxymethoxyuridine methyltransferase n=1 Tax=Paenibacillus solanacearum TaxID=2048548 RepID=A0A916JSZ5_9BACL|nr:class I SAM-dependent methyltransferase [Paenibacillus solanacearum]CAG7600024.1 tRNA 5-carboxymethoxyuridine methyltransferase [Paenibacillus solanacearum]
MADKYHLIFVDWNHAIAWQGDVLDRFLQSILPGREQGHITMLDCSCGIGTQAIGLAQRGYQVTATDISPVSVERARQEAAARGLKVNFGVADFRSLEQTVSGVFDVVLSADNAIPHLLTDEDYHAAASNLYSKVRDGGLVLITIRDYDELTKAKPKATEPRVFDHGKRIVFQVWDWDDDGTTYETHHFIVQEIEGEWRTQHHATRYRALLREELSRILTAAGFSDVEWHMPEQSGYYQPLVVARKKTAES